MYFYTSFRFSFSYTMFDSIQIYLSQFIHHFPFFVCVCLSVCVCVYLCVSVCVEGTNLSFSFYVCVGG